MNSFMLNTDYRVFSSLSLAHVPVITIHFLNITTKISSYAEVILEIGTQQNQSSFDPSVSPKHQNLE